MTDNDDSDSPLGLIQSMYFAIKAVRDEILLSESIEELLSYNPIFRIELSLTVGECLSVVDAVRKAEAKLGVK